MNNYAGETRIRGQNLLIVEGQHEKNELFDLLFQCFPEVKTAMEDIWIYGTNIYMLYEDIAKEYGQEWGGDDIDLPFVISKKQRFETLRYKEDFTNIILVFDYERQDTNFSEEKIARMQRCFIDSADMGKLYINYPMIEACRHLCALPDEQYAERKIPVSMRPGKKYKALVQRDTAIGKFMEFPYKLDALLREHFEITDEQQRRQCRDKILSIENKENLTGQIQAILENRIEKKWEQTATYQLGNMVEKMQYACEGKTYWQYMRNIFRQIILHNICKANRIQNDTYFVEPEKYQDAFEQIDFNEILAKQNSFSRNVQSGYIWVLCTCVFFIAEYNFSLLASN